MLWGTVRLALSAIWRNALRSFLTVLGIVIGVAAVIGLVTIGEGSTRQVQSDVASLGSNLMILRSGAPAQGMGVRGAPAPKSDTQGRRRHRGRDRQRLGRSAHQQPEYHGDCGRHQRRYDADRYGQPLFHNARLACCRGARFL